MNCGLYCNWIFYTGVYKNKLFYTRIKNDENWTNITREQDWLRENLFECQHPYKKGKLLKGNLANPESEEK